jgi:hypothetical protein
MGHNVSSNKIDGGSELWVKLDDKLHGAILLFTQIIDGMVRNSIDDVSL